MILLAIYLFFAGKGYVSIVRSSVLNLISAARQSEYVREILAVKSAAGGAVLGAGYFLAIKPAHDGDAMANSLGAVIGEDNEITARSFILILYLDSSTINSKDYSSRYGQFQCSVIKGATAPIMAESL